MSAPKRVRQAVVPELVRRIHQSLHDENVAPGTHITAQELAVKFGASRWTVSKAFEQLAAQGVMAHQKDAGYRVAQSVELPPADSIDSALPVYFRLAEDRLNGDLPEQVTEVYLRKRYLLTQANLNALLHRVASEGWIQRRAGYGWTFTAILNTPEALEQIYRLRLAIEPAALLEPKFHMPADDIRRLRRMNEGILMGHAQTLAPDALYERGVSFHESIAKASGNPFILDALRRINSLRRLLIYRSMGRRDRFQGQSQGHLQILDLIEKGDYVAAAAALKEHIQGAILDARADVAALSPPMR
jgi:DNA-binding GntR family transcriptional regulator